MGEYLGRMFMELKRRPLFLLREVRSRGPGPQPAADADADADAGTGGPAR
jgi:hypothetical protein